LYVGGNQSTAKVTVADRAGNKITEYFGDIDGAYKRRIVIHVTDDTVSTLYVTFAMHASEPNELMTYSYVTVMAGLVSASLPEVTAGGSVSATASVKAIDGATVNLTNIDNNYKTVYWEHYSDGKINQKAGATDIVTNSVESITQAFYDYPAYISWADGTVDPTSVGNRGGLCQSGTEYVINVSITEKTRQIVVFTGAWNGTGTATMYDADGNVIATSDSWTAGTTGIARQVIFGVEAAWPTSVTIKITQSKLVGYGNVTMVGVGVLEEGTPDVPVVSGTVTATATVTNIDGVSVNLTDIDSNYNTVYWEHYADSKVNQKAGATDIVTNSVESISQAFYDYAAFMNWTDGTLDASSTDNRGGRCMSGAEYVIRVSITEATRKIVLYTGAWNGTGTATFYDANGNLIETSDSWTADTTGIARQVTFDVEASCAMTITIKITQSNLQSYGNATMVAVGVLEDK
jgi:hypothetical protein